MKDLIEFIVLKIVEFPDEVEIVETGPEEGNSIGNYQEYLIKCNEADKGRVIGKNGKIINSIRNILQARAVKDNCRVRISVE